jgi:glutaminyl-tRNA synthetase
MEDPPRKFFRLRPDGEVRLRNAFIIKCNDLVRDAEGNITEIHCEYDPESRSGLPGASRKVKGTIHWVSVAHGVNAEIRLYDRLFNVPNPLADKTRDYLEFLNPDSLQFAPHAVVEPAVSKGKVGDFFQFERVGYFAIDQDSAGSDQPVLNRTVSLRDSWAKLNK